MSIEVAALKMNEQGWTCSAHEPEPFGNCSTCFTSQMTAVKEIVAAWADDRELYKINDRAGGLTGGEPRDWKRQLAKHNVLVQVYPEVSDD